MTTFVTPAFLLAGGSGQFAGEADGGDHGRGIGEAFAGDGEGGAMVRAGAGFWQAEGDVHGVVEIEQFERDEPLIVIHGDDGIEVAAGGIAEDGVGHGGAGEDGGSGFVQTVDGGLDDADFLVAEGSVFTGVGVESCNSDAGAGDAAALEETGGEQAGADDAVHAEEGGDFRERFVDGGQAHGEGFAREQHSEVLDAERMGEIFCLAGEGEAEGLEGLFGNRAGDYGIGGAVFECGDRMVQRGHGCGGGAGVRFAGSAQAGVSEDLEVKTAGELAGF